MIDNSCVTSEIVDGKCSPWVMCRVGDVSGVRDYVVSGRELMTRIRDTYCVTHLCLFRFYYGLFGLTNIWQSFLWDRDNAFEWSRTSCLHA